MALTLPFAHLNPRCNPFGEPTFDERGALAVVDLAPAQAWLTPGQRRALQWIGDSGRGKTTRLLALRHRTGAPYVRVQLERPGPAFPQAPLLLVDELQHLPPRARRRLYRRGAALAIGTHDDLTRELERAGYAVQTVRVVDELSVERLEAMLGRRLEWARRGPGPLPQVPTGACRALLDRFGDDVRAIEHHLYERLQAQEEIGDVEV